MDKDIIYRQDAVSEIHKYFWEEIEKTPHGTDEDGEDVYTDMSAVNSLLAYNKQLSKRIKALPPAHPERPKGKWIHYDEGDFDYDYKCSNCGYAVWDDSDFCPGCGADMREDGKQDGRIN